MNAVAIQKPTIGRIVWYRPNDFDMSVRVLPAHAGEQPQPMMAQIVYVWNDRSVNLLVTDHTGMQFPRSSILLLQGDESYTPRGAYAEWMPYQKGQALKTEALEKLREVHEKSMQEMLKDSAFKPFPPVTGAGISE